MSETPKAIRHGLPAAGSAFLLLHALLAGCGGQAPPTFPGPKGPELRVRLAGVGEGSVQSVPTGINCGTACIKEFGSAGSLTLTAQPAAGSEFDGWSGDCTGTNAMCTLDMNTGDKDVTAAFTKNHLLSVDVIAHPLGGEVLSRQVGVDGFILNCPIFRCEETYRHGTVVDLHPGAWDGWTFVGWGGACQGLGDCQVSMVAPAHATATFVTPIMVTVIGSGTVTSDPIGIDCGLDCESSYSNGDVVLSQVASVGWTFAGWGGDCPQNAGLGDCTLPVDGPKNVTATFVMSPPPPQGIPLAVDVVGSGKAISTPAGIDCPDDCEQVYPEDTIVELRAMPAPGWAFQGWSGECLGGGVCIVSMTGVPKVNVTATFVQSPP